MELNFDIMIKSTNFDEVKKLAKDFNFNVAGVSFAGEQAIVSLVHTGNSYDFGSNSYHFGRAMQAKFREVF